MNGLTQRSRAYHDGPTQWEDHYLYRCYGADDVLLYIGCTVEVAKRMPAHRASRAKASRWLTACMARYEVAGPYRGRDAGREAEAVAIATEQPLFNTQERRMPLRRNDVARYLVEHGHIELAVETACFCDPEVREAGAYDPGLCFAHVAAQVAGITDLAEFDWEAAS